MGKIRKLKAGDYVQVKNPDEISLTLDKDGCVDGLPFMPEMIQYCGQKFKVLYRVEKTCRDTSNSMTVSEFINDNVVFLDNLRCSGDDHNNCQRGCMIFWKESWLRLIKKNDFISTPDVEEGTVLKNQITNKLDQDKFYCQSTALKDATIDLTKLQKIKKIFADINAGTYSPLKALKLVLVPLFRKVFKQIHNFQPSGEMRITPDQSIYLQAGEWVEVKSLKEIITTLDENGKNKGLQFTPDMIQFCGRRYKVRNRLDKMIVEKNGEMIEVKNTVILEDITCNCFYAIGGCPRKEFQYWREIWLKRIENKLYS